MNKLVSLIRQAPKRTTAAVAIIAAAIIIPAAVFAYGPDRPTFTYALPADHVTFNSITDNPNVGDERNFVRIKDDTATSTYDKTVALTPGKTYDVEVYYHNNAATNMDYANGSTDYNSGSGVAHNTKLRIEMPGTVNAGATANINGFISATNANPGTVYDTANASNSNSAAVVMRYVPGSAKVTSNGAVNGAALPDSLFTTGTPLGYDSLNGVLPGCNQFAGYVTFKFTVDQPNFTAVKQVSVDGGKTWSQNATSTAGSTILYRVIYTNTGTTQQDNVTVSDKLPTHVSYVPGSSLSANALTGGSYKPTVDGVTTNGLNIGSFAPTANAYVKFSAKIADSDALTCGVNTLTNTARVNTSGGYKDTTAVVTVNKECLPVVAYTCDALAISPISRTEFKFTTTTSQQNATFKSVTYIIRDASGNEVERKTSTAKTLDYTQNTVGTYTVEAMTTFSVSGSDKTVTSTNCKQPLEVTKTPQEYCTIPGKEQLPKNSPECVVIIVPPVPPVPPVTPPLLPHTGMSENIVAVVGLGALIASFAYYVASRKALNQ